MDLYKQYQLRRVINAYDKATHLGGARVQDEIAPAVTECLDKCFHLHELQDAAGRIIAESTGAEWGGVTACAASAITLGVAAAMTGKDPGRIAQLPDTAGMPDRVILQKGHSVSFGAPVAQMIRLSGATVVEVGNANNCSPALVRHALKGGGAAAVFAVESYHTSQYGGVPLPELAVLAHEAGVPLLVDAATQELRLREILAMGADLAGCSAHKYFGAPTAGVVAGRRDLVEALLLHHAGIGRGMKVGKEGIFGVLAAFEAPMWTKTETWTTQERKKAETIRDQLADLPGADVSLSPDPNGCPFVRVRIGLNPDAGKDAKAVKERLMAGDPSIVTRSYAFDRNAIYINATEMRSEEIPVLCEAIRKTLA